MLGAASRFIPLAYDEVVAERLADLLATARKQRRRAGAMDAIIAATALVHDLEVWTQDDDFDVLAEMSAERLLAKLLVRRIRIDEELRRKEATHVASTL
jgi:predicted nucleic acid-binding protein